MFPERTKWLKRPVGWIDLGRVAEYWDEDNRMGVFELHGLCATRLRVGKEKEELFRFCPRCFVKTK